jgi:hypothetical protein
MAELQGYEGISSTRQLSTCDCLIEASIPLSGCFGAKTGGHADQRHPIFCRMRLDHP